MKDYKELRTWATVRQLEFIDAIEKHGSETKAAKALGLNKGGISQSMRSLSRRAALQGYSPKHDLTHPTAPGQMLRGASTLYRRGEKEPVLQWVKTKQDDEAIKEIRLAAIAAFTEEMEPIQVQPWPLDWQSDVIPWIQIGDGHLGLLAHANEVGENFDLKIAETELCGAIGILTFLDCLYFDGQNPDGTWIHISPNQAAYAGLSGGWVRSNIVRPQDFTLLPTILPPTATSTPEG